MPSSTPPAPGSSRCWAQALGVNSSRRVRLVKGSHLVIRKFWEGSQAYLLQNTDKRVIFVNPYEGDLALIGTTDIPVEGRPEDASIDAGETAYLLDVLARYFTRPARPGRHRPQLQRRPAALRRQCRESLGGHPRLRVRRRAQGACAGTAPLLSVFGGKITTYRKLAEHALDKLAPFFPKLGPAWTAIGPMPGGDLPDADFDGWLRKFQSAHAWLPAPLAHHYGRLYGTRAVALLEGASDMADLGQHFGGLLYEREARFLVRHEWARDRRGHPDPPHQARAAPDRDRSCHLHQLVGRAIAVIPGTVERLARQGLVLGWRHHSSTA